MKITSEEFRKDPGTYLKDLTEPLEIIGSDGVSRLTIGYPVSLNDPEDILSDLRKLNIVERLKILSQFCSYCGKEDPGCQCWNDE